MVVIVVVVFVVAVVVCCVIVRKQYLQPKHRSIEQRFPRLDVCVCKSSPVAARQIFFMAHVDKTQQVAHTRTFADEGHDNFNPNRTTCAAYHVCFCPDWSLSSFIRAARTQSLGFTLSALQPTFSIVKSFCFFLVFLLGLTAVCSDLQEHNLLFCERT